MSRRVNLIPMAGAGQRFLDAGYGVAKPLIDIDGRPMIAHAAGCLPPADLWIFVCREHHIKEFAIDDHLREHFDPVEVVSVAELTEGQACTCMLAAGLLRDDDQLTIGACDNAMTYDAEQFAERMSGDGVDGLIWTFRRNPAVLQDPTMYGWVKVSDDEKVTGLSVKIPISDNPMNDHAVIGAFTFARAGDFVRSVEEMIAQNRRIKNEFYMDEAMNLAVELDLDIRAFEVDRYVCWGTPQDLDVYNYWSGYFRGQGLTR